MPFRSKRNEGRFLNQKRSPPTKEKHIYLRKHAEDLTETISQ